MATDFTLLARERGLSPVSLAVAWVASNPAITAPIIGAANTIQLKDSLASLEVCLDDQLKAKIDEHQLSTSSGYRQKRRKKISIVF